MFTEMATFRILSLNSKQDLKPRLFKALKLDETIHKVNELAIHFNLLKGFPSKIIGKTVINDRKTIKI